MNFAEFLKKEYHLPDEKIAFITSLAEQAEKQNYPCNKRSREELWAELEQVTQNLSEEQAEIVVQYANFLSSHNK